MRNCGALVTLLVGVFVMSACEATVAYLKIAKDGQKIDTGVTDYRYYDVQKDRFTYKFAPRGCIQPDDRPEAKPAAASNSSTGSSQVEGRQEKPRPKTRASTEAKATDPCESVIPKDRVLRKGDSLSINLMYGLICDFYEQAQSPRELRRDYGIPESPDEETPASKPKMKKPTMCREIPENRAGTRGEIAILANIFELGGDKKIVQQADPTADTSARLIYFSGDVREAGQPLNLSNLPIYGPVSYGGRPVYASFAIAELDTEELRETGIILSKLAELGARAYPPSSPVLKALSEVGKSYIDSKQDDLILDYQMTFDAIDGTSPVVAALASGIYVFARQQDRLEPFDWDAHCLDQTTGRVHVRTTEGVCSRSIDTIYRGETYLVIQVKRNEPALDQDLFQTFQEFADARQEQAAVKEALQASLSSLQSQVSRSAAYDRARSAIPKLASRVDTERRQAQEALMDALCLGVADDGKEGTDSLTRDQMFYLVRRAELTEGLDVDAAALINARASLCKQRSTDWSKVEAVLQGKDAKADPKDPAPAPPEELVEKSPETT